MNSPKNKKENEDQQHKCRHHRLQLSAGMREVAIMTMRDELFAYIKKKHRTDPEYLWMRFPGYAVFRHADNDKLFAMIMDVPKTKLGLAGEAVVDILNVKMGSPLLADLLVQQEGYLRGWHIRGGNWVSVMLDGTVPLRTYAAG